ALAVVSSLREASRRGAAIRTTRRARWFVSKGLPARTSAAENGLRSKSRIPSGNSSEPSGARGSAHEHRGMRMIDRNWAEAFAREWVDAWNAHDLERILSHYTDDFEMASPLIVERMGVASGRLKGKEEIRRYWGQGLAGAPNLRFELLQMMVGVNSLAIVYKSVTAGRTVIERIEFDDHGKAVQAEALYGPLEAGKVVGEDEYKRILRELATLRKNWR